MSGGSRRAGRGAQAWLPVGELSLRDPLTDDVTDLHLHMPDGKSFNFADLACGEDLKIALFRRVRVMTSDEGTWGSSETLRKVFASLRHLVRKADGAGEKLATAGDITPAVWVSYWDPLSPSARKPAARAKMILQGLDGLPAATRMVMLNTTGHSQPRTSSHTVPMSDVDQVFDAVKQQLLLASARIDAGWSLVNRKHSGAITPDDQDCELAEYLYAIATTGDVPAEYRNNDYKKYRQGQVLNEFRFRRWMPAAVAQSVAPHHPGYMWRGDAFSHAEPAFEMLALTAIEGAAAVSGLAAGKGLTRSECVNLRAEDIFPAASHTARFVITNKPRRGRLSHGTAKWTGNAVSLLNLIDDCTWQARELRAHVGQPSPYLIVALTLGDNSSRDPLRFVPFHELSNSTTSRYLAAWRAASGHVAKPQSMRNTFTTNRAHYQGHTSGVDLDYMLRNGHIVDLAQDRKIEILHEMHDAAMCATVVPDGPVSVELLPGVPPERIGEINSGQRDTPTGACVNADHGPVHKDQSAADPVAGPCRASFFMCLRCRNCVITRRRVPPLVYLCQQLEILRSLPAWNTVWAGHYACATQALGHFPPAVVAGALEHLGDEDRRWIDGLMNGELDYR